VVYDTTDKYESGMAQPWKLPLTEEEIGRMLKAIVGFSIEITRVEAKFKLGQNRSPDDQQKMVQGLKSSGDPGSVELARFIEAEKNP
jgi:transcriptional regulator